MTLTCELAKAIVAVSNWNQRMDAAWKSGIERPGITWQKVAIYPVLVPVFVAMFIPLFVFVFVPEQIGKWARTKLERKESEK